MKDLLVAGPYLIQDIHLSNSPLVAGLVPPAALVGMGEAINRDLGSSVSVSGMGAVVHSFSLYDGHAKHPPAMDRTSEMTGSTVVDEIRGRATITFLIEISVSADEDDPARVADHATERLAGIMLRKRFSSGSLHPAAKGKDKSLVTRVVGNERAKALAALPFGYVLMDRRDYLESRRAEGEDALKVVMDTVATEQVKGSYKRKRVVPGTLCPISVGYMELSRPRRIAGGRSSDPDDLHCYVETLTSIGEWISIRKASKTDVPLSGALWAPYHDPGRGIYYASATGPLNN